MPRWADALRTAVRAQPARQSEEEAEIAVEKETRRLLEEQSKAHADDPHDPSFARIPRFFRKPTETSLARATRRAAFMRLLESKQLETIDADMAQQIWRQLMEKATHVDSAMRIDYGAFCEVATSVPPSINEYFRPSTFFRLDHDGEGRIDIAKFYQFMYERAHITHKRIELCLHDVEGKGYLKLENLKNYVIHMIPRMPPLAKLDQTLIPFYVLTACSLFFFFLDSQRKGKIPVRDIVVSDLLEEFRVLLDSSPDDPALKKNWFSADSFIEVYREFCELTSKSDTGMISQQAFQRMNQGNYTRIFIKRVFEELPTYNGELDFLQYLELVIATRFSQSPTSMKFFWQFLDTKKQGFITIFTLNMFFREVTQRLGQTGHDPVPVEDVAGEIFDMVKPADPHHITLDDLINCGFGDTIIQMLIDAHKFWMYDNRESMMDADEEA